MDASSRGNLIMVRSVRGVFQHPNPAYSTLRFLIDAPHEATDYIREVERAGLVIKEKVFTGDFFVQLVSMAEVRFCEEFEGSQRMWNVFKKLSLSFNRAITSAETYSAWIIIVEALPFKTLAAGRVGFPRLIIARKNISGTVIAHELGHNCGMPSHREKAIIVNDITYYALMGEQLMSFRQTLVNATERKAFETGTTQ